MELLDLTAVLIGPDGVYAYTWLGKGTVHSWRQTVRVTLSGNWGAHWQLSTRSLLMSNGDGVPDLTACTDWPE